MTFCRMAFSMICAAAMPLGAAGQSFSNGYPSPVLYVETNNSAPNQNAVLAFRRAADGKLTLLREGGYPTGGTGAVDLSYGLSVFANDTPVIANSQHNGLYAVNEGSNTVAVFSIRADGSLKPVPGSPFPSGGFQPVSLTLNPTLAPDPGEQDSAKYLGEVLTVVNKNSDPSQAAAEAHALPNYTSFAKTQQGALGLVRTVSLPATASPSHALGVPLFLYQDIRGFEPQQNPDIRGFVFGADFGSGNLESLVVDNYERLEQKTPLALPAKLFAGQRFLGGPATAAPLGLGINPVYPILYVSFFSIHKIGVYTFQADGKLQFIHAVANPAPTNSNMLINRTGTRMYVSDSLTNQVTTFDIGDNPVEPKAISVTNLRGSGRAAELRLSENEQNLYVISQQAEATGSANDNAIHVLQVGAGGDLLREIQTILLPDVVPNAPAGTRWQGLVAF